LQVWFEARLQGAPITGASAGHVAGNPPPIPPPELDADEEVPPEPPEPSFETVLLHARRAGKRSVRRKGERRMGKEYHGRKRRYRLAAEEFRRRRPR
jgi:hypothetical protein